MLVVCFETDPGFQVALGLALVLLHQPFTLTTACPMLSCCSASSLGCMQEVEEEGDTVRFVDLLKEMLHLEADWRVSPLGLPDHPFFTAPAVVGRRHSAGHIPSSR